MIAQGTERIEHALLERSERSPQTGLLVDGERSFDHRQLARWSLRFAAEVIDAGVAPGDRVAIQLEHGAEAVVALFATWLAGAVAVPINHTLAPPQVMHALNHSGTRVLITTDAALARLPKDVSERLTVLAVPVDDANANGNGEQSAVSRARDLPGGETPAAILYTSGSTGWAKGVVLSHTNLCAGARIVTRYLGAEGRDRILSVLPLSFDYGLNQLLVAFECGATLVLQRSHFPPDVARTLVEHHITMLAGVPPFWSTLERGLPPTVTVPDLRIITNSGGSFGENLIKRYRALWPHVSIYAMYGLTEAFRSTFLPPDQLETRCGSIGKAIPECDVFVVGPDGTECAAGEVGELVHRGPTTALGYWDDPEATARVFRPDPRDPSSPQRVVYSGDLVRRDDEGFLYFVGRSDRQIKCYGMRVSPDEVEDLMLDSRHVAEVAVTSRPDERAGAIIVAHVVAADPAHFDLEDLLTHCRVCMAPHMVPREIVVHDALPRTANGKIDRTALA